MPQQDQVPKDGTTRIVSAVVPEGEAPDVRLRPARGTLSDFSRRVLVALLLIGLAYALYRGIDVLLQTFAGILFAVFLSAVTDWLMKHTGLARGWALTAVVLALFALAAGCGWLLANRVASQVGALSQQLPESFARIQDYLAQTEWGKFILDEIPGVGANAASQLPQRIAAWAKVGLSGLVNVVVAVVLIFFIGIFGAAEPGLYREGLIHLVPPPHRRRAREAIDAVAFNLRWWLLGQLFLMVVIGITTALGLWIIGVRLALSLGLIAGILELVPYLGPWMAAVPAALMSLLLSPYHLVATLGLYLFLHILEGYVLLPLVQRRAVLLPPALTLVAQVLLGELLGLMGLFVAAPLTVAGVVLLKMLYVEDTLGDPNVDVPGEPGNEAKPAAQEANKERKP